MPWSTCLCTSPYVFHLLSLVPLCMLSVVSVVVRWSAYFAHLLRLLLLTCCPTSKAGNCERGTATLLVNKSMLRGSQDCE
ncbi:hypothetical protein JB92DRAFT_2903582 [Gautieria morchelliformis]|nr:hypothetical protein JB92DRAFT_2903582 [Gautieria morchelliformis]